MNITKVTKSAKLRDGICVWFGDEYDDEAYYAHCITEIGSPTDDLSTHFHTAYGWIDRVKKYL
jgi:hypothetical protein